MSRKALTAAVVAATIAWSISLSAFLAPLTAKAATSGSLIKASLPAVYYVGADGKRYVFPNEKTYKTWYTDFSGVMVISDAELATLAIGGNVTYKPGVKMVKIQTDPKTYAVTHNGTLRWVKTEALATALYGPTWNQQIDDVPDAFFTNYTVGADINSASDYSPAAESAAATSINQDKNLSGTTASGDLTFSLAAGTPAAATLPRGATGVNFLSFNVMNSSSSAMTVDTVVVHRTGPGAPADFVSTYLFEGNTRLTSSRTVNSTTNESTFTGLGLALAAGQTRTLWLAADMSTTAGAGNVSAFEVTKVQSGSTLAGGAAMGASMTLSSALVGSLTVSMSGSLTNPKVGQLAAKIGEFQLAAGSSEDLELRRVTLFQGGNLSRSNLTNLVLKQGGSTLATVAGVDSKDHIVFVLNSPQLLEKGATKTYEVYGDISGSARSGDTTKLYAEENVDVWGVGKTYGFGVTVVRTAYDNSVGCGTDASCTTIEGGQITLTFNGPAAHDIPTNGKDQELFNFTMASQSNVEVRNTAIQLDTTSGNLGNGTTAFYTDVKLVDTATGTVVAGPLDGPITTSTNATLTFTDIYNLSAGQSKTFKITADVASATTANETIRVTLNAFGGSSIRNLDNSTFIATSDIVPSSNMVGNAHTVKVPSLVASVSSTPVAQTYIQGSQAIQLAGFNLKAGDSQDIKVTTLTVRCNVDAWMNLGFTTDNADFNQGQDTDGGAGGSAAEVKKCTDVLSTAKLWNGTTQLGDTKSPTTSTADGNGGLLQFTNLNLLVPKGQTLSLTVSGNLSGSISQLNDRIRLSSDTGLLDITAQDPDGNNVAPTGGTLTGPIMTVAAAGTLTVALAPDDSESEAGLVVGGSSNVVLAKERLTAQNEELKLTKIRVAMSTAASTAVSSVSLYDGATLVGGPTSVDSAGHADFSGMNFVIPKDGSKTLTLKANLGTVGPSGAVSGTDLQATFCDGIANGGVCDTTTAESSTFEARGTSAGSSTQLTSVAGLDLAGRTKILRKTKPTVSIVALPSSTLTNGTVVISRFTVSADAAEQVALKKITFNIAINGTLTVANGGADSNVREVGQSSNIAGPTATYTGTCAASGTCVATVSFTNEQTIAAGTSKTYELRAALTGVDTAGESISTSLLGDAVTETGWVSTGTAGAFAAPDLALDPSNNTTDEANSRSFIWSDNSAVPHVDSPSASTATFTGSGDWTNGNLVKILPSDVQTMTRS